MNRYAKMVIIGIIGLVVMGIILGVTSPGPAGVQIPAASIDLIILFVIWQIEDESLRNILIILWFLGFFVASSED